MVEQYQSTQDSINILFSEFGARLSDIEERQRIIKDRMLLIGENLISTREDSVNQDFEIKKQLKQIESEIKSLKQLVGRIIAEIPNLAKKTEVEILERQIKMFQPLEFARVQDIRKIIVEELKKERSKK